MLDLTIDFLILQGLLCQEVGGLAEQNGLQLISVFGVNFAKLLIELEVQDLAVDAATLVGEVNLGGCRVESSPPGFEQRIENEREGKQGQNQPGDGERAHSPRPFRSASSSLRASLSNASTVLGAGAEPF